MMVAAPFDESDAARPQELMKRFRWIGFILLLSSSAGSLFAAAVAMGEIRDNSYLSLGLPHNAVVLLESRVVQGIVGGALAGAVVIGLIVLWRAAVVVADIKSAPRCLPYVLCLSAALILICVQTLVYPTIGAYRAWGVLLMAVVWMGCHSLPGGVGAWGQNRGIKTARLSSLYLVPTVAVMAAFLGAPERIPELLRPEIVVAGAIVYGMMLMVAHRWTGSVKDGIPRRPPWLATVPGILTVVGVLFFRFLIPPATVFARPVNVLVVGIDTLRYDHTSLSPDPAHETTPHLAALAGRGTVFRTAISQAPWTMPAFASIMTGRYPREHGAVSLSGYLRPGEVTLAERLREAGYETKGIVSHIYVNAAHGFAQGFNAYDENNVLGHHEITSRNVTDRAIIFLKGIQGRPFFLFTHYFDPHYEYRDHESVHFADRYTGWLAGQQLDIGGLRDRRHELSREDLNYLRDLYDEEITYTDAEIGRLLDYLRTSGLEQKTIVVVVGDHGEEFMERGWLGHTTSLHREQIHVPLVIALPAGTQQVPTVSAPVETRAILPTVLDYLVSSDSAGLADGSLLPLMTGNSTASKEPAVFSEVWLPDAGIEKRVRMSGVRTRRWKFVRDLTRGEERLFDLDADPGERLNLMDEQPEQGAKLRALLDAWSDQMPGDSSQSTTRAMTREEVEMLRSLGYVK